MKFIVRITHWSYNDAGMYDQYIEEEVDAVDKTAAVAAVRDEFPERYWDAYVVKSLA